MEYQIQSYPLSRGFLSFVLFEAEPVDSDSVNIQITLKMSLKLCLFVCFLLFFFLVFFFFFFFLFFFVDYSLYHCH